MNKQYVLIQEYPGSPTIGTKVWIQNSESMYYRSNIGDLFSKRDIENHPKYWKLVEEEELCVPIGTKFKIKFDTVQYTIIGINGGKVMLSLPPTDKEFTSSFSAKDVNFLFKMGTWIVEEEVKEGDYITFLNERLISSFPFKTVQVFSIDKDYRENESKIHFKNRGSEKGFSGGSFGYPSKKSCMGCPEFFRLATPEEIAAVTTPLFTTEYGKEIYQGDSWWYVIPSKLVVKQTSTLSYKGKSNASNEIKRFSTEKLAQDYLALFKPLLSFNEIEDSLNFYSDAKHFKELVIQRNKC